MRYSLRYTTVAQLPAKTVAICHLRGARHDWNPTQITWIPGILAENI